MIELVVAAAVGYAVFYFFQKSHFERGAERFAASARKEIFDKLNSTSVMPVIQPAFANASTFQVVRMQIPAAPATFLIETAASAGFFVAVSTNILDVLASPTEDRAFIVTMKRGEEVKICAAGSGFALIRDDT